MCPSILNLHIFTHHVTLLSLTLIMWSPIHRLVTHMPKKEEMDNSYKEPILVFELGPNSKQEELWMLFVRIIHMLVFLKEGCTIKSMLLTNYQVSNSTFSDLDVHSLLFKISSRNMYTLITVFLYWMEDISSGHLRTITFLMYSPHLPNYAINAQTRLYIGHKNGKFFCGGYFS